MIYNSNEKPLPSRVGFGILNLLPPLIVALPLVGPLNSLLVILCQVTAFKLDFLHFTHVSVPSTSSSSSSSSSSKCLSSFRSIIIIIFPQSTPCNQPTHHLIFSHCWCCWMAKRRRRDWEWTANDKRITRNGCEVVDWVGDGGGFQKVDVRIRVGM